MQFYFISTLDCQIFTQIPSVFPFSRERLWCAYSKGLHRVPHCVVGFASVCFCFSVRRVLNGRKFSRLVSFSRERLCLRAYSRGLQCVLHGVAEVPGPLLCVVEIRVPCYATPCNAFCSLFLFYLAGLIFCRELFNFSIGRCCWRVSSEVVRSVVRRWNKRVFETVLVDVDLAREVEGPVS